MIALAFTGTTFAQSIDSIFIKKLAEEILTNSTAYEHLRHLTKKIGGRLAGSPKMVEAENWGYELLKKTGADRTYKQECMVPHWVRGGIDKTTITIGKNKKSLTVLSLGNTIGSGKNGVNAKVILINSFDELEKRKDEVKGNIVFYNYKFNPSFIRTFEAYGDAAKYRSQGPAKASALGAVGVIVRSMSHSTDNHAHTGGTNYSNRDKQIPAVAIGLQDADWLANQFQKNQNINGWIKTTGYFLPDTIGHNIIGELKGTKYPHEIITVGAHLDSWDICEGAHDDGAGIVQTVEILRTLKALGYTPNRTIRFVLFANEENGMRGAVKYADEAAAAKSEKHIFGLESDAGGFTPRGFSVDAKAFDKVAAWAHFLAPYGGGEITKGGGGADVGPLQRTVGAAVGQLIPDSQRYFDIHHSTSDVFENVNKRELELGAINMAALIYLIDQYGL